MVHSKCRGSLNPSAVSRNVGFLWEYGYHQCIFGIAYFYLMPYIFPGFMGYAWVRFSLPSGARKTDPFISFPFLPILFSWWLFSVFSGLGPCVSFSLCILAEGCRRGSQFDFDSGPSCIVKGLYQSKRHHPDSMQRNYYF